MTALEEIKKDSGQINPNTPERLWIGAADDDGEHEVWFDPDEGGTAYIRADVVASALESLQRENEELRKDRYDLAYAITGGEDAPGLLDSVPTTQLVEIARNTHRSHSADIDRAEAAEAEVKRLRAIALDMQAGYREAAARAEAAEKALDSLCAWLLHRFGPDSPEGREASCRMSPRTALASTGGEHNGN